MDIKKKSVCIVGGGTAALMLAAELDCNRYDIHIFEKTKSLGNKFLVAGKGGFNLTHSEKADLFVERYEPQEFVQPFFQYFNNLDLRDWLKQNGISTIIGSSGKIYPTKGIKPSTVLSVIKKKLENNNVDIHLGNILISLDKAGNPIFRTSNEKSELFKADIIVFALGGASWKITGSDGAWLNIFNEIEINTKSFEASNCAFKVEWIAEFLMKYEGKPLKNIATSSPEKYIKGELVITKFGLEGGAIYAQSSYLRNQLNESGKAILYIDLKPQLTIDEIEIKLKISRGKKSLSSHISEKLGLEKVKIALLKSIISKQEFADISILAKRIKELPIKILDIGNIDEAISTVGGISLDEIDKNLRLKKLPNHYAIGEMLDWDAPTGGYLLQASFSMAKYLADYLNELH